MCSTVHLQIQPSWPKLALHFFSLSHPFSWHLLTVYYILGSLLETRNTKSKRASFPPAAFSYLSPLFFQLQNQMLQSPLSHYAFHSSYQSSSCCRVSLSSQTSFIFMTSFLCPLSTPFLSPFSPSDYPKTGSTVMLSSTCSHTKLSLTQSYKISHLKHSLGHCGLLLKIQSIASR